MSKSERFTMREVAREYPDGFIVMYDMQRGRDGKKRGLVHSIEQTHESMVAQAEALMEKQLKVAMVTGDNMHKHRLGGFIH